MKVIIAGTRHAEDTMFWRSLIGIAVRNSDFDITELVHGTCRGVDLIADAMYKGVVPTTPFPADWDNTRPRNAAGPIRNRKMAEYADALILIWDGKSIGSASMKREAERAGIPIHEHLYDPSPPPAAR